jgi:hypothetical protein
MTLLLLIVSAIATSAQPNPLAAPQPEVVTNQTVMDLVSAKLPSDVIVTKIQTSQTNFDLSTDALVKLNQSSVPSDVIKAMMQKSSAAASTASTAAALSEPADREKADPA